MPCSVGEIDSARASSLRDARRSRASKLARPRSNAGPSSPGDNNPARRNGSRADFGRSRANQARPLASVIRASSRAGAAPLTPPTTTHRVAVRARSNCRLRQKYSLNNSKASRVKGATAITRFNVASAARSAPDSKSARIDASASRKDAGVMISTSRAMAWRFGPTRPCTTAASRRHAGKHSD